MKTRILLVEDEAGILLTVTDLLQSEGYEVEKDTDGVTGLAAASRGGFDLVILDVMLPRMTGFQVIRELRKRGSDVPVLMLSARSQVADRVEGLTLGADDYLVKPFDPLELLARVEARTRRGRPEPKQTVRTLQIGDIDIDFERGTAAKNGDMVAMTGKELQLLRYLAEHRGRVIPREELLQNVWEYGSDVSSRTVDVHVAWLRQKLEADPQRPVFIHTERGKGYRLAIDE